MLNEQKLKFIAELKELREARGITYQQIADATEGEVSLTEGLQRETVPAGGHAGIAALRAQLLQLLIKGKRGCRALRF